MFFDKSRKTILQKFRLAASVDNQCFTLADGFDC